jgi:ParB-like nuclease family protein
VRKLKMDPRAVLVGERYRRELGSLDALMLSMRQDGQRHPIVLLDTNELLLGERRLEAARRLDWKTIDVVRVETLAEAAEAIRADCAHSLVGTPGVIPLTPTELVSMVQPLYELREREISVQPTTRKGGSGTRTLVDSLASAAVGMAVTRYREIRFAVLISRGQRIRGNPRPVTGMERKLAVAALDQIDAGRGTDGVIRVLRAQLGYRPQSHSPTMPVDPTRVSFEPTTPVRPRKPLLDDLNGAVYHLDRISRRLQRVADDDRWPGQHEKASPATRVALADAVKRLTAIQRQIPPSTTKDNTP